MMASLVTSGRVWGGIWVLVDVLVLDVLVLDVLVLEHPPGGIGIPDEADAHWTHLQIKP